MTCPQLHGLTLAELSSTALPVPSQVWTNQLQPSRPFPHLCKSCPDTGVNLKFSPGFRPLRCIRQGILPECTHPVQMEDVLHYRPVWDMRTISPRKPNLNSTLSEFFIFGPQHPVSHQVVYVEEVSQGSELSRPAATGQNRTASGLFLRTFFSPFLEFSSLDKEF